MRRTIIGTMFLLLLTACSPAAQPTLSADALPPLTPVPFASGERLQVVATTTIVGDVVAQVGGAAIQLTVLMPPNADPHTYEPRPADAVAVAQADVLFVNGLGLERFLQEMLASAGDRPTVPLSAGIQPRRSPEQDEEFDPHVWFDVRNVLTWTENAEAALVALDPGHAATYTANGAAYRQQLEDLDEWIVAQVATIPPERRTLITNHPAFGYFAARYGFEQVETVYPVSPAAEPSAQDIARLEEAIRQSGTPAIFTENTVNPALAEQVARDTGVVVVPLYTCALGGPGSGVESYVALMRYDVGAMVGALVE